MALPADVDSEQLVYPSMLARPASACFAQCMTHPMQPASTHHSIGDQASHDANDAPAQTFTGAAARMMHHAESNTAMQEARPQQLQPAHHARCSRSLALMRAHSALITMSSFAPSKAGRSKRAAARDTLLRGF